MPDVADVTSNALEVVRKAKPPGQLKNPKGLATVGAALIALPIRSPGHRQAEGRWKRRGKAAELGKRVKEKASDKAKDVAGDVADEKLKPSMPKGIGGLLGKIGPSGRTRRRGFRRPGRGLGARERPADADPAVRRRGGADQGRLQPLDPIRGLA